nr:MAG TPA: Baseplate wedge protein [Caudoviricetes sp.]
MLVQATAKAVLNTPPTSPIEGEMYIIGDAPTGTWEGKAKHLAGFFAGVWLIVAPRAGWRVWLEEGKAMRYQGDRWTDEGAGLDDKAPLASPALTGKPTTPTAVQGTNDLQIANTAFVAQAVATLVNSAPETLDTLQELAKALNNDPNFATTMLNLLTGKVSKSGDTMTGSLTVPSIYANDWFRAKGNTGFCFQQYGGGWHMQDNDWIRAWGGKNIYTGGAMKADGGFEGPLHGTASNAEKLGNKTLAELLAEVDRRIAAKHP